MRRHLRPSSTPGLALVLALVLPLPVAPRAAGAQGPRERALAEACRRPLHSEAEVARAVAELAPLLPWRAWSRLTLAELPADVSPNVRAAVLPAAAADREGGPVLYWRPAIDGAVVVHELTHALQSAMDRATHDELLARIAAEDATTGLPAGVVDAATSSVIGGIALALPPELADGATRALRAAVGGAEATGQGALARRGAALERSLMPRPMAAAREALLRRRAAGGAWRAELRALLLDEAHAYEAAARCAQGRASTLWEDAALGSRHSARAF